MCRTYDLATQTQGQCHNSRTCDLSFVSAPYLLNRLNFSFIILHSNVPFLEKVCITHDSATKTQYQGHSSRSQALPLNFGSTPYLLNALFFYKFLVKCLSN